MPGLMSWDGVEDAPDSDSSTSDATHLVGTIIPTSGRWAWPSRPSDTATTPAPAAAGRAEATTGASVVFPPGSAQSAAAAVARIAAASALYRATQLARDSSLPDINAPASDVSVVAGRDQHDDPVTSTTGLQATSSSSGSRAGWSALAAAAAGVPAAAALHPATRQTRSRAISHPSGPHLPNAADPSSYARFLARSSVAAGASDPQALHTPGSGTTDSGTLLSLAASIFDDGLPAAPVQQQEPPLFPVRTTNAAAAASLLWTSRRPPLPTPPVPLATPCPPPGRTPHGARVPPKVTALLRDRVYVSDLLASLPGVDSSSAAVQGMLVWLAPARTVSGARGWAALPL